MTKKKQPAKEVMQLGCLVRDSEGTIADQVFNLIRTRILTLELPPQTKLSETEVSGLLGVSRQPVREAFKRLAQREFLEIRPQSGTKVSLISEDAALRALYIRKALEVQNCRSVCARMDDQARAKLTEFVDQQRAAMAQNDRDKFHAADDAFHREICVQAGVAYVWDMITEIKPHMDRVRLISLDAQSQQSAFTEHSMILDALCRCDAEAAVAAMRTHLDGILVHIETVKAKNHNWFVKNAT
ncbi:GntR family transcriptional regulator [Planktotalea sp.]|uniref:GntR family transcriptional regulator n=1 Tax=Planktotalea sp. TaxID=2029877 RepID=UPI0032989229